MWHESCGKNPARCEAGGAYRRADRERQVSLADRLRGISKCLEPFQSSAFEFGRWIEGPSAKPGYLVWPHVSFSAEAYAFVQAAYDFGWVGWEKFDWGKWMGTGEAIQLRDDPEALAKATPE